MTSSFSRSLVVALALALSGGAVTAAPKKKAAAEKKSAKGIKAPEQKAQESKPAGAEAAAGPASEKKKEERKGPAKFDYSKAPKLDDAKKEEGANKAREESIDRLKSIIGRLKGESPEKAEMLFQLSELYWEKSKYLKMKEQRGYDEAYAAYEKALNQGQKVKEPKLDTRESELFRSETMRLYETILRDYPSYDRKDEVLFNLAYNLYETGKKEPAVKRYEELLKGYPDSKLVADAYIQLGNHYFENNALARAEDNYKKAAATKIPKIYSYATYKLGWCDFNAGKLEEGLKKMQEVVAFSEGQKEYVDLKNEALSDMVTFYVQLNEVRVAIDYFRAKAPKKRQARLIGRLSDGLAGAGHHEKAIEGYSYLINESPMGPNAPEHQQAIVRSYEGLRQRDKVKSEIKKLVDLYRPGSQWWKSNESNVGVIRNAFSVTEEAMRSTVTEYHQEAQKTKSVATYRLARDIYKEYVDAFANSEDENFVSDHSFNLRFYYADILWALEEWDSAATQYDAVVNFKVPSRDSAKEISQESYRKTAAYSSILAYEKLVKIEKGLLGKTEMKENETVDEKKKKGNVEKKAQIKRQALNAEQMKEKPLTNFEARLVAACDRYNGLYKDNADEIEVRYLAAVTLFDKSHFVDATKRFGEVVLKWPEEKRSQDAADLTMSVLEDKQEWLELNKLARAFLGNKKLSKPNTDFSKRVAGVVEGSQYKWIDEHIYRRDKDAARAAEEFLKFVEEFPRSDNADRALTLAMFVFQDANQVDRGVQVGERVLAEYPGTQYELKVRHTLAVFYEKLADFQKSAEMYESFIALYDLLKDPKKAEELKKAEAKKEKKDDKGKKGDKKAIAKVDPKGPPMDRKVNEAELKAMIAEAEKENWVPDAQFNAALWWEGLGKSDKAMSAYSVYLTRFKDKKDVPDISFNIARILEKDGRPAEALKAFEAFNATYAKDTRATSALHYQAKYRQYLLHLKAKNQGGADKVQVDLLSGFAKLTADEKQNVDNLNAYGHARFNALEGSWKQYQDIKFTKVSTIKKDFAAKQKKISELEKQYTEVLAVGSGEWGIAALSRIGLAYADFALNIKKSPDPKGLDEEQLDMYRSELENLAFPLEDKAVEALEKALAKAYELNIYNAYALEAQDKINEYRRGYYAEVKPVTYQGSEFFATAGFQKDAGAVAKATPKPAPEAPAPAPANP